MQNWVQDLELDFKHFNARELQSLKDYELNLSSIDLSQSPSQDHSFSKASHSQTGGGDTVNTLDFGQNSMDLQGELALEDLNYEINPSLTSNQSTWMYSDINASQLEGNPIPQPSFLHPPLDDSTTLPNNIHHGFNDFNWTPSSFKFSHGPRDSSASNQSSDTHKKSTKDNNSQGNTNAPYASRDHSLRESLETSAISAKLKPSIASPSHFRRDHNFGGASFLRRSPSPLRATDKASGSANREDEIDYVQKSRRSSFSSSGNDKTSHSDHPSSSSILHKPSSDYVGTASQTHPSHFRPSNPAIPLAASSTDQVGIDSESDILLPNVSISSFVESAHNDKSKDKANHFSDAVGQTSKVVGAGGSNHTDVASLPSHVSQQPSTRRISTSESFNEEKRISLPEYRSIPSHEIPFQNSPTQSKPASYPLSSLYSQPDLRLVDAVDRMSNQVKSMTLERTSLYSRVEELEYEIQRSKDQLQMVDSDRCNKQNQIRELELVNMDLQRQVNSLETLVGEQRALIEQQQRSLNLRNSSLPSERQPVENAINFPETSNEMVPPERAKSKSPTLSLKLVDIPDDELPIQQERKVENDFQNTSMQTDPPVGPQMPTLASELKDGNQAMLTETLGAVEGKNEERNSKLTRKLVEIEIQRRLKALLDRKLERKEQRRQQELNKGFHQRTTSLDERALFSSISPQEELTTSIRGPGRHTAKRAELHQSRSRSPSPIYGDLRDAISPEFAQEIKKAAPSTSKRTLSRAVRPSSARKLPGGKTIPVPFVVGTNTGKSYSVPVNLQRMFSMLKAHNPNLCSLCSSNLHHTGPHEYGTTSQPLSYQRPLELISAHLDRDRHILEDQLHHLHIAFQRAVRASDVAPTLEEKKSLHAVIKGIIRKMTDKADELQQLQMSNEVSKSPLRPRRSRSVQVESRAPDDQRHLANSMKSKPIPSWKRSTSVSRAVERPLLRSLSLLRSSQKVQQVLQTGF
jgi:hypothetical protein